MMDSNEEQVKPKPILEFGDSLPAATPYMEAYEFTYTYKGTCIFTGYVQVSGEQIHISMRHRGMPDSTPSIESVYPRHRHEDWKRTLEYYILSFMKAVLRDHKVPGIDSTRRINTQENNNG
jgi:hypothetical protein